MNAPKEPVLPDLTLSSDREKVARIQNYVGFRRMIWGFAKEGMWSSSGH